MVLDRVDCVLLPEKLVDDDEVVGVAPSADADRQWFTCSSRLA